MRTHGFKALTLVALALSSLAAMPPAHAAGGENRAAHARGAAGQVGNKAGGRNDGPGNKAGGRSDGPGNQARANNIKADTRTNNVRSTSVNNVNRQNVNVNNNNVNVNRNVNVNVQNGGGCCYNGWDNDYHPVATAAAVVATAAVTSAIIGSIVNAPPPGCVPVNYGGMIYQQCGQTWYQPQGAQFVVVMPPY
jgi:hypothetical protein